MTSVTLSTVAEGLTCVCVWWQGDSMREPHADYSPPPPEDCRFFFFFFCKREEKSIFLLGSITKRAGSWETLSPLTDVSLTMVTVGGLSRTINAAKKKKKITPPPPGHLKTLSDLQRKACTLLLGWIRKWSLLLDCYNCVIDVIWRWGGEENRSPKSAQEENSALVCRCFCAHTHAHKRAPMKKETRSDARVQQQHLRAPFSHRIPRTIRYLITERREGGKSEFRDLNLFNYQSLGHASLLKCAAFTQKP